MVFIVNGTQFIWFLRAFCNNTGNLAYMDKIVGKGQPIEAQEMGNFPLGMLSVLVS